MRLWWSFVSLSALAMGLAGCDSPSPAFMGIEPQQVTVEGSTFSVRATRQEAEAIRVNRELRARRGVIVAKGAVAIETATGCNVVERSLQGDTNFVKAKLSCKGVAPRPAPPPVLNLDCGLVSPFRKSGLGTETAQVDCDVVSQRG